MPRKRKPRPIPAETSDAALLLVEHRDVKGGLGRPNLHASEAATMLGKRRMALMTDDERKRHQIHAANSFWGRMTKKERNIEQRRRARVRAQNKQKAMRAKLGKD
jgi:hypothetical protein